MSINVLGGEGIDGGGDMSYTSAESYPCIGAGGSSSILPVRHPLIQLSPQRLGFPRRRKPDLQLTQRGTAIWTQFQEVGQPVERVHDGVERVGGTELVEKLRRCVKAGGLQAGRHGAGV